MKIKTPPPAQFIQEATSIRFAVDLEEPEDRTGLRPCPQDGIDCHPLSNHWLLIKVAVSLLAIAQG